MGTAKPDVKDLQGGAGGGGAVAPKILTRPMRRARGIRIAIIPDTQDKPGAPQDHADWIGRWVRDRDPAVVVHLGDGPDMGSCSTHDEPHSLAAEGRSIGADLASWRRWLGRFHAAAGPKRRRYIVTLGNHEDRLRRHVDANKELRDTFTKDPFGYEAHGWEVVPYLQPVEVAGIWFCHFYPRSNSGKVTQTRNGAPSALAMLKREMRSCIAGHQQGLDMAYLSAGGRMIQGVVAGSCYLHQEQYLSPQGQGHWAGVLELNEAAGGQFDPCVVSLEFLCRRYGGGRWPR